jgi:hypothetical protein
MLLFLLYFCFIQGSRYEYIEQTLFCLGFALWMVVKMTGSLFAEEISYCDNCAIPSTGLEPMPNTSVALTAHYLNVRQHKLGTNII